MTFELIITCTALLITLVNAGIIIRNVVVIRRDNAQKQARTEQVEALETGLRRQRRVFGRPWVAHDTPFGRRLSGSMLRFRE
jgi:hypothetical protein